MAERVGGRKRKAKAFIICEGRSRIAAVAVEGGSRKWRAEAMDEIGVERPRQTAASDCCVG